MPYRYHRECPICHGRVKDLSTHLRQQHKLPPEERTRFLSLAKMSKSPTSHNFTCQKVNLPEEQMVQNATKYSGEVVPSLKTSRDENTYGEQTSIHGGTHPVTNQTLPLYLSQNLVHLRKFFAMTKERKKWYIKREAPESFIRFLREGLAMIVEGQIVCSDEINQFYRDKLLSKTLTHDKARIFLSNDKFMDFVQCMSVKVVEFLAKHLA